MNSLKRYVVRKWLHLLPYEELKEYVENEGLRLHVDSFYQKVATRMIDLFYREFK